MEEITLPDAEALVVQLTRQSVPGVTVTVEPTSEQAGKSPIIIPTVKPTGAIEDAPEGYGYTYAVSFVIVGSSRAEAFALAGKIHTAWHGFAEASTALPGLGQVGAVDTTLYPERTGSAAAGDTNFTEFLAVYAMEIHPHP